MNAGTIAIRFPIATTDSKTLDSKKIFKRIKERATKLANILFAKRQTDESQIVKEIQEKLDSRLRPKKSKKVKLTIHVAQNNKEAAEKTYEGWEHIIDEAEKREMINRRRQKPQKGDYDRYFNRIVLNLQEIRRNCETEKEKRAVLILTTIHEYLHSNGDLGNTLKYKGESYDTQWLNEGFTELQARKLMKELYPADYPNVPKNDLEEYSEAIEATQRLIDLVGEETVADAYFSENINLIFTRAEQLGVLGEVEKILEPCKRRKKKPPEEEDEQQQQAQNTGHRTQNTEEAAYSLETIEKAKEILPENAKDYAARLVLDAAMMHMTHKRTEPTQQQILNAIMQARDANNGITAYMVRDLLQDTMAAVIEPLERRVEQERAETQQQVMNVSSVGEVRFQYDLAQLVEAAQTNYFFQNKGRLATPEQLVDTIVSGAHSAAETEVVTPNVPIVSNQLMVNANREIQAVHIERSSELNEPVRTLPAAEYEQKYYGLETQTTAVGATELAQQVQETQYSPQVSQLPQRPATSLEELKQMMPTPQSEAQICNNQKYNQLKQLLLSFLKQLQIQ